MDKTDQKPLTPISEGWRKQIRAGDGTPTDCKALLDALEQAEQSLSEMRRERTTRRDGPRFE